MNLSEVLQGLDKLFAEARIDEIEPYLIRAFEQAGEEGDYGSMLSITNELIGYSREVCHYEQMISYGQDALKLVEQMGITGTIPHATTLLNIANGLRAGGYLDQSADIYEQVEELYKKLLPEGDFGFADLYNNRSLLYQEQGKYEAAAENLEAALQIAEAHADRIWEVATTHANLATTYVELARRGKKEGQKPISDAEQSISSSEEQREIDVQRKAETAFFWIKAEKSALRAIQIYNELKVHDTHYAAAMSALGKIYEERGQYGRAVTCYQEAGKAIRSTLGETDFYRTVLEYEASARKEMEKAGQKEEALEQFLSLQDRGNPMVDKQSEPVKQDKTGNESESEKPDQSRQESRNEKEAQAEQMRKSEQEICPDDVKGLDICQEYYEQIGLPFLREKYGDYLGQMTIGLSGEGSDCFGFDDVYSRDHDWGPGFCIWLEDELFEQIGEALRADYEKLPKEWKGYQRLHLRDQKRITVHKISDWFRHFIGETAFEEWRRTGKIPSEMMLAIPSYKLAAVLNGRVFQDVEDSTFTKLRDYLMDYYETSDLCLLLAEHVARFSQNAQYNYSRMKQRGEAVSASLLLHEGMKEALKLGYLLNRRYAPHDKWLLEGAKSFEILPDLTEKITRILQASAMEFLEAEKPKKNPSEAPIPGDKKPTDHYNSGEKMNTEQLVEELATEFLDVMLNAGYIGNAQLVTIPENSENGVNIESSSDLSANTEADSFTVSKASQNSQQYYLDTYLEHYIWELSYRSEHLKMTHEELVEYIAKLEFQAFDQVKNEGGRAECQDDWYTFRIMRTSQYTTWTDEMLIQYAVDFRLALDRGWNMIMEKYGRMEESTTPEEWNRIKREFPEIPEAKKNIMEQIIQIQVGWMEAFANEYPGMASNARRIHTSEDMPWDTSYETYLRGELSTYSDCMLKLYGQFIVGLVRDNKNLAYMIMEETVHQYGYSDLADAAGKMN